MNSSSRLIRAFTAALKTLFFLSGSMFSKNQRKNCPKFSAETDRVKNVVEKCGQSGHVKHARVEPGKTGKVRKEVILRQPYLDVRCLLILVDVCPYGGYDALIQNGPYRWGWDLPFGRTVSTPQPSMALQLGDFGPEGKRCSSRTDEHGLLLQPSKFNLKKRSPLCRAENCQE